MTKTRKHWLFKSEPDVFSWDDLWKSPGRETSWDGVRNYQARNFLRDEIAAGDGVLFYHSSTDPMSIVGTATVVRGGYPDASQFDPDSNHFDPKARRADPTWFQVDIRAEKRFPSPPTLAELRAARGLEKMVLLQRGSRLSIQPVSPQEWAIVVTLGAGKKPSSAA